MKLTKENIILLSVIGALVGIMYNNMMTQIDRNLTAIEKNFDYISTNSLRIAKVEK